MQKYLTKFFSVQTCLITFDMANKEVEGPKWESGGAAHSGNLLFRPL